MTAWICPLCDQPGVVTDDTLVHICPVDLTIGDLVPHIPADADVWLDDNDNICFTLPRKATPDAG